MSLQQNDQIVCILGAGGRIGWELAHNLIEENIIVALADINLEAINSKLEGINYDKDRVILGSVDLNSENELVQWLQDVIKKFGALNGAVNCAYPIGPNYGKDLFEVRLEDFNKNVSSHIGAYFNFLKNTSELMLKQSGGSIVNISSIYGSMNPRFEIYENTKMTMPVEYAAAKSSINHLTSYFAKKLVNQNIRVNSVSPGGIADDQPDNFKKAYNSFCLNKGLLDVEDITPLIKFLLSEESRYINGQVITIDDGFSL